jgi:AcrR family transcriptional regulator
MLVITNTEERSKGSAPAIGVCSKGLLMATLPTRERLLTSGAALFAERGFHGVSIEDLGASIGLTGPAIYRHFKTKSALLAAMLISVSQSLLDGAEEVIALEQGPKATLSDLIDRHLDFALTKPALIKVQERDFANLDPVDADEIRRLQRRYVEIWAKTLESLEPHGSIVVSRIKAHAIFGLLNSTPRIHAGQKHAGQNPRMILKELAERALL